MKKACVLIFILLATASFALEEVDKSEIVSYAGWESAFDQVEIDLQLIEELRAKVGENLRIDVYFAFWCIDSKNNLPEFIEIIDAMDHENVLVHYYKVERKPTHDATYYVEDLKVERIPTFIFYRGGQEIGRIIENPEQTLVEDFLAIVSASSYIPY